MGKMKEVAQAWKDLEVDKDKMEQIRQKLQELKRKKAMQAAAQQAMDVQTSRVKKRPKIDILKDELGQIDQRKAKLIETIELLESLPFKAGDVAIHPLHGNVLISEVFVPGEADHFVTMDLAGPNRIEEPTALVFIPGAHGAEPVPISELVPFNDTSQVLYAKK